jgi:hypothetical protein
MAKRGHCIPFNLFVETQHTASLQLSGFEHAGAELPVAGCAWLLAR